MTAERGTFTPSFDEIVEISKKMVMRDGHHSPILIVDGTRNSLITQLSDIPETHSQRMQLMDVLGRQLAKDGKVGKLREVIFISEGWMSAAREGKLPSLRPSQDPNRKEVLIVSGLKVQEPTKLLRIFEMVRDGNQKVIRLDEIEPGKQKSGSIEVPLLEVFASAFQTTLRVQVN